MSSRVTGTTVKGVDLIRNNNRWTEARFKAFIKGQLRSATRKWGPIQEVKKNARVGRGLYLCNGCKNHVPVTLPPLTGSKRIPNVFVDHILPVIDPSTGFTDWDSVIERMFVEQDGLQILCKDCHDKKTSREREASNRNKNA